MYTGNTAYKVGTETDASDFKIELRFSPLVLGDLPGMHPKIAIYVSEKEESECEFLCTDVVPRCPNNMLAICEMLILSHSA